MTWHNFSICFSTPAFLGVDPPRKPPGHPDDPLSAPFPVSSLRGALRYWLRALAGAHVGNNLAELHRIETEVFGAAAGHVGQPSRILLRARAPMPIRLAEDSPDWLRPGHGAITDDNFDRQHLRYLLGQGLYDQRKKWLTRRHVPVGGEISLAVRNLGTEDHATLFLAALWAMRTFGGLGARVHRGFGTVMFPDTPRLSADLERTVLERDSSEDLHDVLSAVGRCLHHMDAQTAHSSELARYPHFDLTVDDLTENRRHHQCMDEFFPTEPGGYADALSYTGSLLRDARAGDDMKTDEYDNIVDPFLTNGIPGGDPFRLGAYGLPVGFSDLRGPKNTRGKPSRRSAVVEPVRGQEAVRRSSPLWLRVRNDSSRWSLRSLAFYSEWLPADTRLRIRDATDRGFQHRPQPVTGPSQSDVDGCLDKWIFGPPDSVS